VEFTLAFSVSPAPTTTALTTTTIIYSTTFMQHQPSTVRLSRTRSMANHHHHHHHHERLSYARSYETAAIKTTTSCSFMSLVPLAVEDGTELISVGTAPTALQYTAYLLG
jgi:hypothetical protein